MEMNPERRIGGTRAQLRGNIDRGPKMFAAWTAIPQDFFQGGANPEASQGL